MLFINELVVTSLMRNGAVFFSIKTRIIFLKVTKNKTKQVIMPK